MKISKSAAALALFVAAAPALAADPLEGVWQTAQDDNGNYGHIRVAPCGEALCGVLIRAFDAAGEEIPSENIGKQIVWDMMAKGDGTYADGKVWSPDRDKTYSSRMVMSGDSVTVKGCIFVICRDGGTWRRVE